SDRSGTGFIVSSVSLTEENLMDEFRARRVVDALRERGVNAHLLRGTTEFGVRVSLPGGREAEWDNDGTAGLEAQVMRAGMLVGFVPTIEGSEDFDEAQVIDAIARADYAQPVARLRASVPPAPPPPCRPRAAGSAASSTASATADQVTPGR